MILSEQKLEQLIRSVPSVGPYHAGAGEAAKLIAKKLAEGVVYEEGVTGKFISTPSLDCNFLALKGGLFNGAKIPVDAATGTLLDGQRVTVTVTKEG